MPDSSLQPPRGGTQGPAPTPEFPVNVSIDGNLNGPDLIRRLARGGLALVKSDDGLYAVIVIREKPVTEDASRGCRVQLFQAAGVAHAVRCALDSDIDRDESQLASALEAAGRLIDDVAGQLEEQA